MFPNVLRPRKNHDVTTSITNQIESGVHLGLAKVIIYIICVDISLPLQEK